MSFSFHVPHGSAPPPELPIPNQDGIFEGPSHILSASANEAAVRAVNDALSGASEHARHPDPRSGLLESHIFPVIYTEYHFEDLKFGYLQYTKEMVEKHRSKGIVLSEGDIATYWVIQVRREYPDGHPLRRVLMEQMGRYDIQVFWEHRSKRDAKDKKIIKALNKKVEGLNKQVKLLNEELARMDKGAQKPVKANQNDVPRDASDNLPETTTCEPVSEQHRKRKRTGSTSEGRSGNDNHRPFLVREDDVVTNRRRSHTSRPVYSGLPLRPRVNGKEDEMRDDE